MTPDDEKELVRWAWNKVEDREAKDTQAHAATLKNMRPNLPEIIRDRVVATPTGIYLLLSGARPIRIKENGDYIVESPSGGVVALASRIEEAIVCAVRHRNMSVEPITLEALVKAGWRRNETVNLVELFGLAEIWHEDVRWAAVPARNGTGLVIEVAGVPIPGIKSMGKLAEIMAEFKQEAK